MLKLMGKKIFYAEYFCLSKPVGTSDSSCGDEVMERSFQTLKERIVSSPARFVTPMDVQLYINSQTGMDRLKAIFEKQ